MTFAGEDAAPVAFAATEAGSTAVSVPIEGRAAGASRGKFYLTYPKKLVKEPLIYQMARKFDLVFNVRSASVSDNALMLEVIAGPDGESQP